MKKYVASLERPIGGANSLYLGPNFKMAWVPPLGFVDNASFARFTNVEMSEFASGREVEDQLEELLDDEGVQVDSPSCDARYF